MTEPSVIEVKWMIGRWDIGPYSSSGPGRPKLQPPFAIRPKQALVPRCHLLLYIKRED